MECCYRTQIDDAPSVHSLKVHRAKFDTECDQTDYRALSLAYHNNNKSHADECAESDKSSTTNLESTRDPEATVNDNVATTYCNDPLDVRYLQSVECSNGQG